MEGNAAAPVRRGNIDAMSKHWCFTLNNYTVEEENFIRDEGANVEYVVFGKEHLITDVNPHGTPHLQGYVVFINRKRLSGCKKWLARAHWEIKRGSPLEASNYCKKEDPTPFESGIEFMYDGIWEQPESVAMLRTWVLPEDNGTHFGLGSLVIEGQNEFI